MVLVVFAVVVSMQQFVGDPIICWAPQHFTDNHLSYVNAYCWVRNTYYLPFNDEIPAENELDSDTGKQTIPYYQWIPFILLGMALGFYAPNALWHSINQSGGVDADTILESARGLTRGDKMAEKRGAIVLIIRNQMHRFLSTRKTVSAGMQDLRTTAGMAGFGTRRFGCYLMILYIISKTLYLTNAIVQLYLLNSVLAMDYSTYGIEIVNWMLEDHDWTYSPEVAFPRVTMCDFKVRRLGNVHRYTVQCTLPINLYNERIFMFLWFWMLLVAVCTAVSLVTWVLRLASHGDRITYILNHLKMSQKLDEYSNKEEARNFTTNYLQQDGVFLLRLIGHNTNTMAVSEIISCLWDHWREAEAEGNDLESTDHQDESLAPALPEKEPMMAT